MIKIVFISDTHNKHKLYSGKFMPDGDIVIHSGDISSVGHEHEVKNFLKWFSGLDQYKYKIFIAGNHDWLFERNSALAKDLVKEYKNVVYLEDSGVEIEGYYFYGTPVQKHFFDWAFNRSEEKMQQHWNMIPDKTDVLITHSPPFMIGDYVPWSMKHEGSSSLYLEVVNRIKPIIHVFGHIHEGRGIKMIDEITFINATCLNGQYHPVYNPIVVEINANEVNVISD